MGSAEQGRAAITEESAASEDAVIQHPVPLGTWLALGAAGVVLVVLVTIVLTGWGKNNPGASATAVRTSASPSASSEGLPSFSDVLRAQSAALLRGDEAGWMALVDRANPDLMARYRSQFKVLRALRVTEWEVGDVIADGSGRNE